MACLLVVDDDLDVGDALAELLRMEGHDVRVARNGQDGLLMLDDWLPDIVLLDVEMPRLTGPEMAGLMLLRDQGKENIPVVFLSGVSGLSSLAAKIGTPYFLAKPYTLDAVLLLVSRVLVERAPPRPGVFQ